MAPVPSLRRRGLALAAGGAVLLPVLTASPAAAAVTAGSWSGSASAQSLGVDLAGPEGEGLSLALSQSQGRSVADRSGEAVTPRDALAFAGVVGGTPGEQAPAELAALNGALATLQAPGPVRTGQGLPANPLLVAEGLEFSAVVTPTTGTESSSGDVSTLETAPLGSIEELAPLTGPISTGLGSLLDALAAPLGMTVGDDGLGAVLDALTPVTGQLPEPVAAAFPGAEDQLAALVEELLELDALLFDAPLLTLADITQEQSVTQEPGGVRSVATTTLARLDLLGGLLSVDGPQTRAETFVNGVPGQATADATAVRTAELGVLDLLELLVGPDGPVDLTVLGDVADPALEPVEAGLLALETALEEGLGSTGLRVEAGAEDETVSPDGLQARASASGLLVSLTPPGGEADAAPVLRLAVGDSQAVSAVAPAPVPAAAPPAAARPVPQLPRTGGEAPLAAVGLALLAGAALLRRRRSAADA